MKKIFVVTEGQSETNFVNRVLSPYFLAFEKILIPTTVLTKNDEKKGIMHKGGGSNYDKFFETVKKDMANAKHFGTFVTTMIDFYALPKDTPGITEAEKISDPYDKVSCIEKKMLDDAHFESNVYFPYIQLHEFESLVFTDLDMLGEAYFEYDITPLKRCLEQKMNPELVNDGNETSPSKRILHCIPDYDKSVVGVSVLEKIGVEKLCQRCRHFGEWIFKMRAV